MRLHGKGWVFMAAVALVVGVTSTALAIEMLEGINLRSGRGRGLDIGSGSGILALAMLRLGARKAIAFDIDLDAFRPLRENRQRNGVAAEEMPIFIGPLDAMRGGRFDVITVNILPEVIIPAAAARNRAHERRRDRQWDSDQPA